MHIILKGSKPDPPKMTQNYRRDMLKLLQLIMSSKSKEEQQQEALLCLRSNPDLILSMLQLSFGNDAHKEQTTPNIAESHSCTEQNIVEKKTLRNVEELSSGCEFKETIDKRKRHNSTSSTSGFKRTTIDMLDSSECEIESQCDDSPPVKRRKSKYHHLHGDLSKSNVRRDPRTSKAHQDTPKTRAIKKQCGEKRVTSETEEPEDDVLLVRKLIQMLIRSKSRQHQECVLTLLRSDQKLMEIFKTEKSRIGKLKIPMFRQGVLHDSVDIQANQSEQVKVKMHCGESQSDTPTTKSDSSTAIELDYQSSEALINHLSTLLNSNKVVDRQNESTDSSVDDMLMNIPLVSLLNDDNNMNDQTTVHDELSTTTVNNDTYNDHEQTLDDGYHHGYQSSVQSDVSTPSPIPSDSYFDAMVYEHFQELSHDLYQTNNVDPSSFSEADNLQDSKEPSS